MAKANMGDRPKNSDHTTRLGHGHTYETPTHDELPWTPGRVSANPDMDTHVEILKFLEEEDQYHVECSLLAAFTPRRPVGPYL